MLLVTDLVASEVCEDRGERNLSSYQSSYLSPEEA